MAEGYDRYLDLFVEEATDLIEELNQGLLVLEKEGFGPEIISEIFRTAHTLKSSAAFVGLETFSDLAHNMEDLFQNVRDGKVGVSTELVNLVFTCLDEFKRVVNIVAGGTKPVTDYTDLIQSLKDYAANYGDSGSSASAVKEPVPVVEESSQTSVVEVAESAELATQKEAENVFLTLSEEEEGTLEKQAEGRHIYDGMIRVDSESAMKNMRFLLVIQRMKKLGSVFKSEPPENDLEKESGNSTFKFVFCSNVSRQELLHVCEVDMVEDLRLVDHTSSQQKAGKKKTELKAGMEETRLQTKTIKVSAQKIDSLMNDVGELVITNSGLLKVYEDLHAAYGETTLLSELKSNIDGAARIARELQSGIMQTRMIPVGIVFHRFTRPVRDMALELGKEIEFKFQGEDTELDKNILDALNEPLMHLLRNSLDHGVETKEDRLAVGKPAIGNVLLNSYQSGSNVYVEIRDDGRGLNKEAILKRAVEKGLVTDAEALTETEVYDLIFHPGFSTAEHVTDISGRGVGMNVVKKMAQDFNGTVQVQNSLGEGCSFILSFPLTLAIISAILVRANNEDYAFPLTDVVETMRFRKEDLQTLQGRKIVNLRGEILPVYSLAALQGAANTADRDEFPVVIAYIGKRKVGFIVDQMIGKYEIVIKSLEANFRAVVGLIGACLMGDGRIIMVLDCQGLLDIAQKQEQKAYEVHFRSVAATILYNQQVLKLTRMDGKNGKKVESLDNMEARNREQVILEARRMQMEADSGVVTVEESPLPDTAAVETNIIEEKEPAVETAPAPVPAPAPETETVVPEPEETEEDPDDSQTVDVQVLESVVDKDRDVTSALERFEKEKEQRIIRAQNIVAGKPEAATELTEEDLGKLYGVINTGMINAGLVLSQLLGVQVEVSVPEVKAVEYKELMEYIPAGVIMGVHMDTTDDFLSTLLLLFDEPTGYRAAGGLMGLPAEDWEKGNIPEEDLESVLCELTNIVGASILNAMANKTSLSIQPTVPHFAHGPPDGVTEKINQVIGGGETDHKLIYISADFFRDDMELLGRLFLLPSKPSLNLLISKL